MAQHKLFVPASYVVEGKRMKLTELFLGELEREGKSTRKVLERVPKGKNAWKPHDAGDLWAFGGRKILDWKK